MFSVTVTVAGGGGSGMVLEVVAVVVHNKKMNNFHHFIDAIARVAGVDRGSNSNSWRCCYRLDDGVGGGSSK